MADKTDSTINATDELTLLLNRRLQLSEKFAKNYLEDVKKWQKDYNITTVKDSNFTNLDNQIQIPYIFSTVESGSASIFEKFPQVVMKQRGKEDRQFSEFAESIWDYLNDKLGLEEKVENAAMLFLNDGQVSMRYGWEAGNINIELPAQDPTGQPITDEQGKPVMQKVLVPVNNLPYIELHDYRTIRFSPESTFILDDDENLIPYTIWFQTLTKEQAEERYGITINEDEMETIKLEEIEKGDLQTTDNERLDLTTDLKRVLIYNYVGMLPKDKLTKEQVATYRAEAVYYTVFTKKRTLKAPVLISKKPILNLGNYGLPNKFYRFGEAKVLRELEQDVSLGRSRIMDLRDRQGTKVGVPQGTEFDEASFKKSRDYTFMRFMGNNPPLYINPPPLPETILTALNQSKDISRASMTNTVSTATGQKIFNSETNKRNAKKKKKIARFLRAIAKNLLILCGENWDEETMSKITDIPPEVIQQQGWKKALSELGNEYDVDIDTDTLGDSKEQDAANAIAMFRELKDSPYVNQEELIKQTMKLGFNQKDSDKLLSGFVSPETITAVIQNLLQAGVIMPEDAQVIAEKLDMIEDQKMAEQQGGTRQGEGRPPVASPTDIVKKGMPGTDAVQMSAQRSAAYKQQNQPKGPQTQRR
jgi:hypothetical protein